jgi:thymidine kinase
MKSGKLHVVCGCMSSGKSTELTRQLRRATIAKVPVFAFKPLTDTRDGVEVRSRDGQTYAARAIGQACDALAIVPMQGPGLVGFDEAQFFDEGIIGVVDVLLKRGHEVVCAGLDTDFRGEPFGSMPGLLARADEVKKLTAVCMRCNDLNATRSQRLIDGHPAPYDAPTVQVGGEECYEARCRSCHEVPHAIKVNPAL